ncbi:hypothetical protein NHX12_009443, partial [Muraenolepis orangiensis]
NPPVVLFLHSLSDNEGDWSILPLLPHFSNTFGKNSSWLVFLEEETNVKVVQLLQVLSKFDRRKSSRQNLLITEPFREITGQGHYMGNRPGAGWALSISLVQRLGNRIRDEPLKSDFTIDLKHEVALYIWDGGEGPRLTGVPELCTELQDSPSARSCATSLSSQPPACGEAVDKEDVFVAIKTCKKFHAERVPVVKQTWEKEAALLGYYSDHADPSIPTTNLSVPNTERGPQVGIFPCIFPVWVYHTSRLGRRSTTPHLIVPPSHRLTLLRLIATQPMFHRNTVCCYFSPHGLPGAYDAQAYYYDHHHNNNNWDSSRLSVVRRVSPVDFMMEYAVRTEFTTTQWREVSRPRRAVPSPEQCSVPASR